jgi:hypothetical protein
MSEKIFAKLNGKVVNMVAHGDYLYVAVLHMGQTIIYRVDVKGNFKEIKFHEETE